VRAMLGQSIGIPAALTAPRHRSSLKTRAHHRRVLPTVLPAALAWLLLVAMPVSATRVAPTLPFEAAGSRDPAPNAPPPVVTPTAELARAVREGDRRALARAITLVESTRADHRDDAVALLEALLPATGGDSSLLLIWANCFNALGGVVLLASQRRRRVGSNASH